VTASVLLVHGSNDSGVPSFLADQTYVALRRLGKEVTYARYEGEEHAQPFWGTANARDYLTRLVAWFDQYLGTGGAARPGGAMSEETPSGVPKSKVESLSMQAARLPVLDGRRLQPATEAPKSP
jgi:hypothetical protein